MEPHSGFATTARRSLVPSVSQGFSVWSLHVLPLSALPSPLSAYVCAGKDINKSQTGLLRADILTKAGVTNDIVTLRQCAQ